jgi:hypothetical protein
MGELVRPCVVFFTSNPDAHLLFSSPDSKAELEFGIPREAYSAGVGFTGSGGTASDGADGVSEDFSMPSSSMS